ncbi:hypothetical protein [Amycolatopsis sp. cmx-4-68]
MSTDPKALFVAGGTEVLNLVREGRARPRPTVWWTSVRCRGPVALPEGP